MNDGGITAAVLAHNAVDRIHGCLDALLAQTRPPDEIVVIDNGSEDLTTSVVQRDYPAVRLVRVGRNTGCSGGRNRQLNAAGHRYVMIVDDDAVLHETCLEHLVKAMRQHPDASIWSPRVCYEHDRGLIQSDGVTIHYLGEAVLINPDRRLDGRRPTAPPISSTRRPTTSRCPRSRSSRRSRAGSPTSSTATPPRRSAGSTRAISSAAATASSRCGSTSAAGPSTRSRARSSSTGSSGAVSSSSVSRFATAGC